MNHAPAPATLCRDDEMGYERARTAFVADDGMTLDERYRLAHLPLVAPDHPDVIASAPGEPYRMGRRPCVTSLTLHVPAAALEASSAYAQLQAELRDASFNAKIAWDVVERRRDVLHATICGSMGAQAPPGVTHAQAASLAAIGPFEVELRGVFSGNVNHGRLYLRAYPERRDGENVLRRIQRAFGRQDSDLFLVGVWNLTDHLDSREAGDLSRLIDDWWDRPIARFAVERLRLITSFDDLVLDGGFSGDVMLR